MRSQKHFKQKYNIVKLRLISFVPLCKFILTEYFFMHSCIYSHILKDEKDVL